MFQANNVGPAADRTGEITSVSIIINWGQNDPD